MRSHLQDCVAPRRALLTCVRAEDLARKSAKSQGSHVEDINPTESVSPAKWTELTRSQDLKFVKTLLDELEGDGVPFQTQSAQGLLPPLAGIPVIPLGISSMEYVVSVHAEDLEVAQTILQTVVVVDSDGPSSGQCPENILISDGKIICIANGNKIWEVNQTDVVALAIHPDGQIGTEQVEVIVTATNQLELGLGSVGAREFNSLFGLNENEANFGLESGSGSNSDGLVIWPEYLAGRALWTGAGYQELSPVVERERGTKTLPQLPEYLARVAENHKPIKYKGDLAWKRRDALVVLRNLAEHNGAVGFVELWVHVGKNAQPHIVTQHGLDIIQERFVRAANEAWSEYSQRSTSHASDIINQFVWPADALRGSEDKVYFCLRWGHDQRFELDGFASTGGEDAELFDRRREIDALEKASKKWNLEALAKSGAAFAVLFYVLGILVVNMYLFQKDISDFALFRVRFIVTGALSFLPILLCLLGLAQIRFQDAQLEQNRFMRQWMGPLIKGAATCLYAFVGTFLIEKKITLAIFIAATFLTGFSIIRLLNDHSDTTLSPNILRPGLFRTLTSIIFLLLGGSVYLVIFSDKIFPKIPEQFGGAQPKFVQLLIEKNSLDGARELGVPFRNNKPNEEVDRKGTNGKELQTKEQLSLPVKMLFEQEDSFVLEVADDSNDVMVTRIMQLSKSTVKGIRIYNDDARQEYSEQLYETLEENLKSLRQEIKSGEEETKGKYLVSKKGNKRECLVEVTADQVQAAKEHAKKATELRLIIEHDLKKTEHMNAWMNFIRGDMLKDLDGLKPRIEKLESAKPYQASETCPP
jgi:hypothetical protein